MKQDLENDNTLNNTLSMEEANALVVENQAWAESIAKSVARAWNLDWKIDGLDGAALEALIFCSRRFDPTLEVPFKAYARKRIHEASQEAARKSKGWAISRKKDPEAHKAKEVSQELLKRYPELMEGQLVIYEDGEEVAKAKKVKSLEAQNEVKEKATRLVLREMLLGADIIATRQELLQEYVDPDELLEAKRIICTIALLEIIHQQLIWAVYWEDLSLRSLAQEWKTDELNVIREHRVLLDWLSKNPSELKKALIPKVRPGLRAIALQMKKNNVVGKFTELIKKIEEEYGK